MKIKIKSTSERLNRLFEKLRQKKRKKARVGGAWFRQKREQQNNQSGLALGGAYRNSSTPKEIKPKGARKTRSDKGKIRVERTPKVKGERKQRSDKGKKRHRVKRIRLTGETVPRLTGEIKQRKKRSDAGTKRKKKELILNHTRRLTGEIGVKKARKPRSDKGKKRVRRKWLEKEKKRLGRKWKGDRALKYLPTFTEKEWIMYKDSDDWFRYKWGEARDFFSSEEEFKEYIKDWFTMKKYNVDLEELAQSTGMDYGRYYRHKMTEHFMENFKREGGKIWDK